MHSIGQSVTRSDSRARVTGEARFARDLSLPGMLHMKLVFAGRPHARIVSLDPRSALAEPGVVAVFTAADVPRNRYGIERADQQVFCDEVVRCIGDRVAAVVAETPEQAARAIGRLELELELEDLPAVFEPLAAMLPGAPLVHDGAPGNIAHRVRARRGDVERGFAQADVVVEHEYHTPTQEHAFLEPESALATFDDQGRLTVHAAGQNVHEDRRQIAEALCLPPEQVRVLYCPIGGAFGGREDISVQIVVALAAWRLRRPVKIEWTRQESIRGHPKRHAMILRHKWGATRSGRLVAARVEVIADAGAYYSSSVSVLDKFRYAAIGPYDIPNVAIDAVSVFTHNLPSGAFRGYGAPQAAFGAELQVNRLAEALGVDPISLRLRNCLRDGSVLPIQSVVPEGVSLPRLIEACARAAGAVETHSGWLMPQARSESGPRRRGFGLAVGMKNCGGSFGFPEGSAARVVLHGAATIDRAELHTAAADVGQGSHSVLSQIAAEALGIPFEWIELAAGDTALIGDAGFASASRLTLMAGNAVRQAARLALEQWRDEVRPAVGECRWEAPRTTAPDPDTGACVSNISFGYAAQMAEVEVDVETGQVFVRRVWAAHDPGRAVNPQQVRGQIEGAMIQAMGWTLVEDFVTDGGTVRSDRLSTYLIPTVADIPDSLDIILIEQADPVGPYGARGVGEIGIIPLAPAIVSAVHDAVGVWFDRIPLRAERVLATLKARRRQGG